MNYAVSVAPPVFSMLRIVSLLPPLYTRGRRSALLLRTPQLPRSRLDLSLLLYLLFFASPRGLRWCTARRRAEPPPAPGGRAVAVGAAAVSCSSITTSLPRSSSGSFPIKAWYVLALLTVPSPPPDTRTAPPFVSPRAPAPPLFGFPPSLAFSDSVSTCFASPLLSSDRCRRRGRFFPVSCGVVPSALQILARTLPSFAFLFALLFP